MVGIRLVLRYWGYNPYEGFIIFNFIGLIVVTFFVSLVITAILRKIPGVKRIL